MTDYNDLMEVHRALGRLEGKLDALLAQTTTDRSDNEKLRSRVAKLEAWRNYLAGGWAVLVILGAVFQLLVK